MDPITLFALANGAVAAVKKGCQLYKDIKSAAGDVKGVLKDLDDQFHQKHPPNKPATAEQRKQFVEEKNRIIEMNKRGGETSDIYDEIGQNLSVYFENMSKCFAIFEEEEKHAKEVYVGTDSVGKRALQRVLMKKKLEQMAKDLRELMVYQSPPELGPLFSDVEEMMKKIGEEQKVAIAQKMHQDRIDAERRRKRNERMIMEITWGIGVIIMSCCIGLMFAMVVGDRIKKYPQLGDGWIPTTPQERAEAARPRVWTGR